MIFDTKLGVDIDAAGFYARLWPLWNPLEWFGTLQNQYIGYAVPMAPFFLAGQALRGPGLADRAAAGCRCWWPSASAGLVRLAGRAPDRLRRLPAAGRARVFALWPTFTIVIGSTSAAVLPGLARRRGRSCPWSRGPRVPGCAGRPGRGERHRVRASAVAADGRRERGRHAGCALVAARPVHPASTPGAARLIALACAGSAAVARWPPPGGPGRCCCRAATRSTSCPTSSRPPPRPGPCRPRPSCAAPATGRPTSTSARRGCRRAGPMVAAPAAILASRRRGRAPGCTGWPAGHAAAALAAPGAWAWPPRWRWPGTAARSAARCTARSTPLLNGTLAPLRNVYKFEPVGRRSRSPSAARTRLARAGQRGRAAGCGPAGSPQRGRGHRAGRRRSPPVLAGPGAAVPDRPGPAAGLVQPGARLLVPGGRASWPPTRRAQTGARRAGATRTASTCGATRSTTRSSRWPGRRGSSAAWCPTAGPGRRSSSTPRSRPSSPASRCPACPRTWPGPASGTWWSATTSARPRSATSPPQIVHQTLALSGFRRVAVVRPADPGRRQTDPRREPLARARPAAATPRSRSTRRPARPGGRPRRSAALPVSRTVLVNGGPDALLQLAGPGRRRRPARGDRGRPAAGAARACGPSPTAQRRADNELRADQRQTSRSPTPRPQTNPPDDPLGGAGGPPRQLLPVPAAGHQTVAVLSGAAQVTASSYGSWLDPGAAVRPGQRLRRQPRRPRGRRAIPARRSASGSRSPSTARSDLPATIGIQLLDRQPQPVGRRPRSRSAPRRAGSPPTWRRTSATQPLRVRPGPTRWLRVTITAASNVVPGATLAPGSRTC